MKNILLIIQSWFKPTTVRMVMAGFERQMVQLEQVVQHQAAKEAQHAEKMVEALKKQEQAQLERLHAASTLEKLRAMTSTVKQMTVAELKEEIGTDGKSA